MFQVMLEDTIVFQNLYDNHIDTFEDARHLFKKKSFKSFWQIWYSTYRWVILFLIFLTLYRKGKLLLVLETGNLQVFIELLQLEPKISPKYMSSPWLF